MPLRRATDDDGARRHGRPPVQGAPLADDLGIEHLGDDRALGGKAIFQDVQLARIAGAQDDGAVVPFEQAVNLAVIEPGEFGLFLAGLIDLEELALLPGAEQEPAVQLEHAQDQHLFAEDLADGAVGGDAKDASFRRRPAATEPGRRRRWRVPRRSEPHAVPG